MFDTGGWGRILSFRAFRIATVDLCKTFSERIKKLYVEQLKLWSSLESFVVSRLISLDKNAVIILFMNDVTQGVGALQRRAEQDEGVEAVVPLCTFFQRKIL